MIYPLEGFDVIHASPPCQAYSTVTPAHRRLNHPDLIGVVRTRFLDRNYVIENVDGARRVLKNKFHLCGSMFGLKVRRHRWFECPALPAGLPSARCKHRGHPVDVSGTGGRRINRRENDNGGNTYKPRNIQEAREAMGIDWMTRYEISQAIPPAYTEFIGKELMGFLTKGGRNGSMTC
jgi:DNA (cytosine-5)-methyltransferase 1